MYQRVSEHTTGRPVLISAGCLGTSCAVDHHLFAGRVAALLASSTSSCLLVARILKLRFFFIHVYLYTRVRLVSSACLLVC